MKFRPRIDYERLASFDVPTQSKVSQIAFREVGRDYRPPQDLFDPARLQGTPASLSVSFMPECIPCTQWDLGFFVDGMQYGWFRIDSFYCVAGPETPLEFHFFMKRKMAEFERNKPSLWMEDLPVVELTVNAPDSYSEPVPHVEMSP